MAVTTKKTFNAVGSSGQSSTTVFTPVSIQLNNQDDLDVYVTLSGGTRVLQLRQSTASTATSTHPQVNNTDGLYFPAISVGTQLYNYTLSTDNNTITFSSALPSGAVVFIERRTRDASGSYTTFANGSTIRAKDLNDSSQESNFTAQDGRNKAIELEGAIFGGAQITVGGAAQPFVDSSKIIDGSIVDADINASAAISQSKIATGTLPSGVQINSNNIVNNSIVDADINSNAAISHSKLNLNIVNSDVNSSANIAGSKLANDSVTLDKLGGGALPTDITVASANIVNGTIVDADISSTANIAGSKLANTSVTTNKIANNAVTSTQIATNAVTTDKIADAELSTLANMQSTTASNLASPTALTATTAELNQLDGITLETSLTTNSNTRIPTSKAVNDLVLSVVNAVGGFVAIANETSFPTSNPDPSNNAGTVVSISQLASGLAVNGSGVATIANGAGTGNTVTITGFPSSLHSQTLPTSSGLQVQTTSTTHTYTFHKQLASAADIQAISATVNSFSNRYRVSASAPTSSLDGGDLWYDTTNSKLMVYSSQNSAWEESSAIGNFFISTISSSSSTGGGSATANGTAYRFTISNAPTDAQQLLVSVDGVIQKPNAGSSQPSEGFVLVGNDIIFGSAPANGASMFVTVIGSTVGIGTPSNNTVSTVTLQNAAVTTSKIADEAVTLAKLPHGTSSNNGKFLRANNGADPTFEVVNTDLVADTSPQLGGNLDTNGKNITFGDSTGATNNRARFGGSNDLELYHSGSNSNVIHTGTGNLNIQTTSGYIGLIASNQSMIKAVPNAAVELYHNNSKRLETVGYGTHTIGQTSAVVHNLYTGSTKRAGLRADNSDIFTITDGQGHNMFLGRKDQHVYLYYNNNIKLETTNTGVKIGGNLEILDDNYLQIGNSQDFTLSHSSTYNNSLIYNNTGDLYFRSDVAMYFQNKAGNETYLRLVKDQGATLYYNNSPKLETVASGVQIVSPGNLLLGDHTQANNWQNILAIGAGTDLQFKHDGTNSIIENYTGDFYIQNNYGSSSSGHIFIRARENVDSIQCIRNGEVKLYDNGNLRFQVDDQGVFLNSGGLNLNRQQAAYSGAIYFAGFGDTNHMLWQDYWDNPNGTRGSGNGYDGVKWNTYNGIKFYGQGNESRILAEFEHHNGCKLYHGGTKRLQTTASIVEIENGLQVRHASHQSNPWFNIDANNGSCDIYRSTTAGGIAHFFSNVGGTRTMKSYINESGNLTSTSDYRLKTDVEEVTNGISLVKNLKPSTYKWKHDSDTTHHGFIAHELQAVLPNCVEGEKDAVKEDGTPHYQFVCDKEIIPVLTAALKEAIEKIETLETKVKTLEAA